MQSRGAFCSSLGGSNVAAMIGQQSDQGPQSHFRTWHQTAPCLGVTLSVLSFQSGWAVLRITCLSEDILHWFTQTLWQMLSASTQWQLTLLLLNRLQLVQVVASEKRGSSPNPQGMKFDWSKSITVIVILFISSRDCCVGMTQFWSMKYKKNTAEALLGNFPFSV